MYKIIEIFLNQLSCNLDNLYIYIIGTITHYTTVI